MAARRKKRRRPAAQYEAVPSDVNSLFNGHGTIRVVRPSRSEPSNEKPHDIEQRIAFHQERLFRLMLKFNPRAALKYRAKPTPPPERR